jgi:predicted MFS family arabinose efflux permease
VGLVSAALLIFAQSYLLVLIFVALPGIGVGIFTAADWAAAIDLVPDQPAPGLHRGLTNVATAGGDALATPSVGVALFLASLALASVVRSCLRRAPGLLA